LGNWIIYFLKYQNSTNFIHHFLKPIVPLFLVFGTI